MNIINKDNKGIERKRFLSQIFLCFLLPILIMLLSTFLVYNNYKNSLKNQITKNNISNLSALADTIDSSLNELQSTTLLLSTNSDLYNIFYSDYKVADEIDISKFRSITDTLLKFKATKSFIDSVYMLHKNSNEVLTVNGSYDIDSFYSKASKYKAYNKDFWMNLKLDSIYYKILNPTSLEANSDDIYYKRDVIPFVTANIESFKSNNLFVINISTDQFASLLDKYKFSKDSILSIINKKGVMFASTNTDVCKEFTTDSTFLSELNPNKKDPFEYTVNGNKYMAISFVSSAAKFNDFIYVALVPYNDFYQNLSAIKRLAYFIILFGMCISIFTAYFLSKKIYSPINNLIHVLKKNNPNSSYDNEIDYLNTQIGEIIASTDTLKGNISELTPLVSAQYLTKILTDIDFMLDENVKNFINSGKMTFEHSSFCVSLFELNFTEKYHSIYTNTEYLLAIRGISKMLQNITPWDYPIQMLRIAKTKICIIINVPQNESLEKILENIKNVISIFSYDSDLINITVGIGRIYPYLMGMNKSYNEAVKTLSTLSPLSEENIQIYSNNLFEKKFNYSINDENKLYNYLIGCYKNEAIDLINFIIEENKQNLSHTSLKLLYLSIYNTISRVATEKKVSISKIMDKDYIDLESNVIDYSVSVIDDFIKKVVSKLSEVNKINSKFDINEIITYINEHYTEDIYLEKIAEIFNISDKHLSKVFKNLTGISFHTYISNLRITKSKKLLLETDLSVIKIGEMVGFSTHSTFFRIFKKFEGINPTQFREINKDSAK